MLTFIDMFGQFTESVNKMGVFPEVKEKQKFAVEIDGLFHGVWQLLSKSF